MTETLNFVSFQVLAEIKLNEQDTTSSGRIYIKIIFQELAETMGVVKLYERINDPYVHQPSHSDLIKRMFLGRFKPHSKGCSRATIRRTLASRSTSSRSSV